MNNEPLATAIVGAGAIPVAGEPTVSKPLSKSDQGVGPYIQRFGVVERTTHALVMVSFFGLVITGVPLRFASAPWAAPLMSMLGGAASAAVLHRICAVITFAYFALHLATVARNFIRAENKLSIFWGPRSMVPQPKDVQDVIGMFKWFLGRGPRPKFDRFSYMEKFDYLAVFWGVAMIGGTGLLLWFPTFFSRFLPGWMFNIATIIHGDEALLALGFIFTIHFFNSHLRPEKFPMDLVIFTGRVEEHEFMHERPLEAERLQRQGRLEGRIAPAPRRELLRIGRIGGTVAVTVGLSLFVLIVYAFLSR